MNIAKLLVHEGQEILVRHGVDRDGHFLVAETFIDGEFLSSEPLRLPEDEGDPAGEAGEEFIVSRLASITPEGGARLLKDAKSAKAE